MATRITAAKLRDELTDTLNRVAYGGERMVLERYGKELVALIPLRDLELLYDMEDAEEVRAARAEAAVVGTVTLADYKAARETP